jgi:hypothetical protein
MPDGRHFVLDKGRPMPVGARLCDQPIDFTHGHLGWSKCLLSVGYEMGGFQP